MTDDSAIVSDAVLGSETEPEPSSGTRCRTAALVAAGSIVLAGTAIAVGTAMRRSGRRGAGPPVTQIGLVNVVSRPHVYRPVLRGGSQRRRARGRDGGVPERTSAKSRRPVYRVGRRA